MEDKVSNKLKELAEMLSSELSKKKAEQQVIESFGKLLSDISVTKTDIGIEQVVEQVDVSRTEPPQESNESFQKTEEIVSENETISESTLGLVGGDTTTKTVDPITPLAQNFVTFEEMNKHYKTYIARIQQQLSTLGGGGEVNFRYLDDVNRGTMNSENDNWVLEYDATTKKAQFTENLGPIKTIRLNTTGSDIETVPGMLSWNTFEDCLDVTQSDGSSLQVGLENYIQVMNNTGETLYNGECVRFAGVSGDEIPEISKMIGDGTLAPLIMIGVLTNTIADGEYGRATILGKVRAIDTTGTGVEETWAQGDLLYVHPTISGKLTKVRPTAPNIVVSVAAVLKVGVSDGILLVRPVIWPRNNYGVFVNITSETATTINTPYTIPWDTTQISVGHDIGTPTSRIVAQYAGLYNYSFTAQLTSTNSSTKNAWFWARKNGVDIPFSTKVVSITGNGTNAVVGWDFNISMTENDYFELVWAVSDTTVFINAPIQNAFSPTNPAIRITVSQVAL